MAYIHAKCPICFKTKDFDKYKKIFNKKLWFISIDDFYKNEWFVDLNKLKQIAPEINWLADRDAVDPENFSIDGFKFATH